jgi:hypothetical protein
MSRAWPDAEMGRRHRGRGPPDGPQGPAAAGSFMIHVRHAAAAIALGLCKTVVITHGESGRSGVGRTRNVVAPTSLAGQFEHPDGAADFSKL